jgi:LysR family transcriptional regulator, regulator for metE and metH
MPTPLELRHLRTLAVLQDAPSLSAAAERLHLTQSALSHQLKLLEGIYELPLLERRTQPVRLTPAGLRLAQLGEQVMAAVQAAERELADMAGGSAGALRIAVECHTCFDWLMPAMDAFRPHWPGVELDIVSGFHADPVGLVVSDRAELAITSEPDDSAGIAFEPLFQYPMLAVMANDHRLTARTHLTPRDFAGETLITYPVPDALLDIMKVLAPAGVNPVRRTSELTVAILQLVASRRGIAVLPSWTLQPYVERGYIATRPVGKKGLTSRLYAAAKSGLAQRPYVQAFVETLKDRSFQMLPGIARL